MLNAKSFMLRLIFVFFCLGINTIWSQNITVSTTAFSDQELIEDVLFGTNCVSNIIVTNTVSGNFSGNELSYGFFDANNSDFPFQEGIVLTTGRMSNVPGPNTSLSDDNASNWVGDLDLENELGITNTINATIIEFSFVPQANNISFRYLFASEEYREDEPTTCQFSDAFAFLIRPIGGTYDNLALVPGTNTPVQVTTVRPAILDECDALNEEFFGQFNEAISPINFNGQTAILTAETDVISGQTYEVKLVIADETNFRFDSAVFIEANSFNVGIQLGEDIVLCESETTNLEVDNDDILAIRWFYNGMLINNSDTSITVSQDDFGEGLYAVEVDLNSGCTETDDIEIVYDEIDIPNSLSVFSCIDENGFGVFNLLDVSNQIDSNLQVLNFYNTIEDAENEMNSIQNPNTYPNQVTDEVVFVTILSPSNCIVIREVLLLGDTTELEEVVFTVCPALEVSPTSFVLQALKNKVSEELVVDPQDVDLFFTVDDAISQTNEITSGFVEVDTDLLPLTIYARINADGGCLGIAPLVLSKIDAPQFSDNTSNFLICEDDENPLILSASLQETDGEISYEWSTGETTETISVTEAGSYSVDVTRNQSIEGQEIICTNFKNFTVIASSAPTVTYSQTGFAGENNQLIINAEGSGDYEYSLNGSDFTDSPVFNVKATENVFIVRDKNGCGEVIVNFVALRIPSFFTPNADGFNDYWQVEGIRQNDNDISSIFIFDRYGKMIYQSSPKLIGWDGTYNGTPVPAQDYWYRIQLNTGRSVSGHFTLKR